MRKPGLERNRENSLVFLNCFAYMSPRRSRRNSHLDSVDTLMILEEQCKTMPTTLHDNEEKEDDTRIRHTYVGDNQH